MRHNLGVQRHIDGHFPFVFKIDSQPIQNFGRDMHLGGAFGHRIAEGRERDEGNPRLKPKVARHASGFDGDGGQVILIGPLMHKGIGDQHDPALVQKRCYTNRPI